jgi:hypothetical protein
MANADMPLAGPALDAALARLLGWTIYGYAVRDEWLSRCRRGDGEDTAFIDDEGRVWRWDAQQLLVLLWAPSAGIVPNAALWDVIETLRARWHADDPNEPFYWRFEDCGTPLWRADIVWDHHDGAIPCVQAGAATLSLAVCHAAYRFLKEHEAVR